MKTYTGDHLARIRFPLGGIGSGSVSLCGDGSFADWEIFNAPNKGSRNGNTHFAVKASRGGKTVDARVLRGDQMDELEGTFADGKLFDGFGWGPARCTMAGFPHFQELTFTGSFPTAELDMTDPSFPGHVRLEAWSPFVPLQEDDSSAPAACFTLSVQNTTPDALDYTFAFCVSNPAKGGCDNASVPGGVVLRQNQLSETDLGYGELCALTSAKDYSLQRYLYRGAWFDALTVYWQQFCADGPMPERNYEPDAKRGSDCAVLTVSCHAEPGETAQAEFVLSWYYPNRCNDWTAGGDRSAWKNWYATRWNSAEDVGRYLLKSWDRLQKGTVFFRDALHRSDLPLEVVDAASCNLAVLRSPVCLRLEDGTFYGWEGAGIHEGSCEGTCTHVWSYAYALCYLFPALERSIRDADYKYNQEPNGYMAFRLALPLGYKNEHFHACVDGQMLGIVKVLREWQLSGDNEWLHRIWPFARKALEWAWHPENDEEWDADCDGILEGRQHHTLDMELFGPSSWLEGLYLAALKAAAILARQENQPDFAEKCDRLYENGKAYLEKELFNGAYYVQKVDLTDKSRLEHFDCVSDYWNEEACEYKYQIAGGSSIDQMLAQYHAALCGLGDIFDKEHRAAAIRSMLQLNYKPSMREFANPCRLYALNGEGGTVMCAYPRDVYKPVVSLPYAEECMTGFEYAFAALAISDGFVEEGLECVRAIRDRYDGKKRNPFNELECGSNYARSMASFALIPVLTGFRTNAVTGELFFAPKAGSSAPFFCGTGWGEMEYSEAGVWFRLLGGTLKVRTLHMPKPIRSVAADGRPLPGTCSIPETVVTNELDIRF